MMRSTTALILFLCALTASAEDIGRWDRFEATITNSKTYSDPYNDVTLNVTYTAPDGETVEFWGFYDGDETWKLRFMPDRLGVWRYVSAFSDGSPAATGSFRCVTLASAKATDSAQPTVRPPRDHPRQTTPWCGSRSMSHQYDTHRRE